MVLFYFAAQGHDLSFGCHGVHFKEPSTSKLALSDRHIASHTLDPGPGYLPHCGSFVLEIFVDFDNFWALVFDFSHALNSHSYVINSPLKGDPGKPYAPTLNPNKSRSPGLHTHSLSLPVTLLSVPCCALYVPGPKKINFFFLQSFLMVIA